MLVKIQNLNGLALTPHFGCIILVRDVHIIANHRSVVGFGLGVGARLSYSINLISLGCAKNQVDSEIMLGVLCGADFNSVEEPSEAEIIIINTCGFITTAKEESINTILAMAQYKQTGKCRALIATGCLAQKYKDELLSEMPELDGIAGTGEVERIAEIVGRVLAGNRVNEVSEPKYIYDHLAPRVRSTPTYTAFVKVAEGCDNCCSYCVIPEVRGAFRSRTIESIVEEVKGLAASGTKEIILIAQDTTRYGQDIYGEYKLPELIRNLASLPGVEWIRLLYCYPTHFTQELIDTIASEAKVCRYIDIPLQHSDDEILTAMLRKGNSTEIEALITNLRLAIPELALRTTFIVGFPGETEANFANLLEFVQRMRFDRVGVFTYSQEEGTPAGAMLNQIPEEIKEERQYRLMSMQSEISAAKQSKMIGRTVRVIVEGKTGDQARPYIGRTEHDAPEVDGQVYLTGNDLFPGQLVEALITASDTYDLIGEVIR